MISKSKHFSLLACKLGLVILLAACQSIFGVNQNDLAVLESIAVAIPALQQLPDAPWTQNSTANACLWTGIACTSGGRVYSIDLRRQGLQGTMPDSICSLPNITELYITNNSLSLPSSFENCTALNRLEWSANNLSIPVPSSLCQLRNATIIRMFTNRLYGPIPACFGQLQALQILDLSTNDISALDPSLGNLTSLTYLKMWNNALSGELPVELCGLTSLQTLDLGLNNISGTIPECFSSLINLTCLNLSRRNISARLSNPFPDLANLTNLQILSLSEQNGLTGPFPSWISNLANLRELYLNGTGHSGQIPDFVTSLTQLRNLQLQWSQFTGTIPSNWSALTQLYELRLGIQQITGTIPASIGDLLNLEALHLQSSQISGTIPDTFIRLTKLKNLRLHYCRLNGTIPLFFSQLGPFTELTMHGNKFIGALPADLTSHVNGIFSFFGNQLSGCVSTAEAASAIPCNGANNRYLCGCDAPVCGMPMCDQSCGPLLPVREAYCTAGTWLVPSSVISTDQEEILISRPITFLGDFVIPSSNSTVTINFEGFNASRPVINVTGCAAFDGTLRINLQNKSQDDKNDPIWIAEFAKGLCSRQTPGDDGKFTTIVATRQDTPCNSVQTNPSYSTRSLTVIMGDPDLTCLPSPAAPINQPGEQQGPSSSSNSMDQNLPIALIAGCVAGGVVALTVLLLVIICCCRDRCVPADQYKKHWRRSRATNRSASTTL